MWWVFVLPQATFLAAQWAQCGSNWDSESTVKKKEYQVSVMTLVPSQLRTTTEKTNTAKLLSFYFPPFWGRQRVENQAYVFYTSSLKFLVFLRNLNLYKVAKLAYFPQTWRLRKTIKMSPSCLYFAYDSKVFLNVVWRKFEHQCSYPVMTIWTCSGLLKKLG